MPMSRRGALAGLASLGFMNPAGAKPGRDAERMLLHSAEIGDADTVARLVGIGTDIEVRDARGRTALMIATHKDHVEVARILIEAGADVNAKDSIDDSPFLYAGAEGRIDILRLTLAHGANLAATNRYGGTALIPAAHHGHVEAVYLLLKTKIDINHVNNLGWTALLEAVILGDGGPAHEEIVEALLHAGADVRIADREGVMPCSHAERRGYARIVALIAAAETRSR